MYPDVSRRIQMYPDVSRCIQMYPVFIPNHSNFGGWIHSFYCCLASAQVLFAAVAYHFSLQPAWNLRVLYANFQTGMLLSRNAARGSAIIAGCWKCCLWLIWHAFAHANIFCVRIRGKLAAVVRCCEFQNSRKMSRLIIICGPIVSILAGQTFSRQVITVDLEMVR